MYHTIFNVYLYTAVLTVIPLMLLVILNTLILTKMIKNSCRTRKRNQQAAVAADPSQEPEGAVSLVLVVFFFIFCNSLGLAVNMLESFLAGTDIFSVLVVVSNLLVVLNATLNFAIYYVTTGSFRRTFHAYCCCCCSQAAGAITAIGHPSPNCPSTTTTMTANNNNHCERVTATADIVYRPVAITPPTIAVLDKRAQVHGRRRLVIRRNTYQAMAAVDASGANDDMPMVDEEIPINLIRFARQKHERRNIKSTIANV